jgi:hypothetical protein
MKPSPMKPSPMKSLATGGVRLVAFGWWRSAGGSLAVRSAFRWGAGPLARQRPVCGGAVSAETCDVCSTIARSCVSRRRLARDRTEMGLDGNQTDVKSDWSARSRRRERSVSTRTAIDGNQWPSPALALLTLRLLETLDSNLSARSPIIRSAITTHDRASESTAARKVTSFAAPVRHTPPAGG